METATRFFTPALAYWRKRVQFLAFLTTICSLSFITNVQAQGSCEGLFTLDATRTYDAGTNTTTFLFTITKTGAKNDLSHWGIQAELCPNTPGSIGDLLKSATAQTSTNGVSWTNISTSYENSDPSIDGCGVIGDVLKFNQQMNEGIRYFRLVFNGNVNFNITLAYIKYGTACCKFTNVLSSSPTLTCPENKTVGACLTQNQVNTAFNEWLNDVVYSNGTLSTIPATPTAPSACGGSTTVTWKVDGCGTTTCSATFTVQNAPAVSLTAPANKIVGSCLSQEQVNTAFADWLDDIQASGGCDLSVSDGDPTAPAACGGTVTVTWTATSTCGPNVTASASFTVQNAPAVVLNCPDNFTTATGLTQEQVNAAFNTWLNSTQASGGCGLSVSYGNPTAPNACGGSVEVTWTASSTCEADKTCSATFTVPTAAAAQVTCPSDQTVGSCLTQDAVNTAFNNWLASVSYSNGTLTRSPEMPTAPAACGGSVTVTWTVTNSCGSTNCSATFTVQNAPAVNLTCPQSVTIAANQTPEQIATLYAQWLTSASATGGCNVQLSNNSNGVPTCGQTATVTWTATSACEANKTCSATFTVPACVVYQGCTPGYWKNHPKAWGCGYTPTSKFFTVFSGVTNRRGMSATLTLGQAVSLEGGNYNALARHAVAALLNACHSKVAYPYTEEEIKTAVKLLFNNPNATVMLGGVAYTGVEQTKDAFDRANNLGCPLNNSNYSPGANAANISAAATLLDPGTQTSVLTVTAGPNPYIDQVQFRIESPVSGPGVLEVYNLLGQKVQTVFQGHVFKGKTQTVNYNVPPSLRTTLIYQMRVGSYRTTGRLLNGK